MIYRIVHCVEFHCCSYLQLFITQLLLSFLSIQAPWSDWQFVHWSTKGRKSLLQNQGLMGVSFIPFLTCSTIQLGICVVTLNNEPTTKLS